jgi:hypothetical protein
MYFLKTHKNQLRKVERANGSFHLLERRSLVVGLILTSIIVLKSGSVSKWVINIVF